MSGWAFSSDSLSWFASGRKCLSLQGIQEEKERRMDKDWWGVKQGGKWTVRGKEDGEHTL